MKNQWKILPEQKAMKNALESLDNFNVKFVKWDGAYKGTKSEIIACCNSHGEFKVSLSSVRYKRGGGCPKCIRLTSPDKIIQKVKIRCAQIDNEFLGFVGEFFGSRSTLLIGCKKHGNYEVGYTSFIHKFSKCSQCFTHGYDSNKPGTVYVLLNKEKNICKVGISNDYRLRLHTLKRMTPFSFEIKYISNFKNGSLPKMIEKMSHLYFKNAQLKGFDGSNEWILYDDSVDEFFKRLSSEEANHDNH